MKLVKWLYNFLFKKRWILVLGGVFLFFSIRETIELVIQNLLVDPLASKIDSTWYNDIFFIFILLSTALYTVHKLRQYVPSWNFLLFLLICSAIYLFYRISVEVWSFTSMSYLKLVKYADLLVWISVFQLLLFIPNKKNKKDNNSNSFSEDRPLGSDKTDEIGYGSYANNLAKKIIDSHCQQAFAIGINGKWGLGKTSFIDLIKREVNRLDSEKELIELHFNPWSSSHPNAIIRDFFDTLQEKIRPYHSSISRMLIRYSSKLVALYNNRITQTIQVSIATFTGVESIASLYDNINNALKKIDKKIIIYIDDLDRLDKEEIIEVIRLIRNTANFYNTFFIVAYDRNYVINALKDHNAYRQEEFLEKIFQIEVTLPYFRKHKLTYRLIEQLKEKLPEPIHEEIDKINARSGFIDEWLESLRDVTRLTNSLGLNLTPVAQEVDFNDFIRLELLRLKYPSVYELIFRRTSDFLETYGQYDEKRTYKLKEVKKSNEKYPNSEKVDKYLEHYLLSHHSNLAIPERQIAKIINLVDSVFINDNLFSLIHTSHLSVVYPSKFYRYFSYKLLEDNLSEVAFSQARLSNQGEFNAQISQWVDEGLELELKDRFFTIQEFDNREDFEKCIRAILYLANLKSKIHNYGSDSLVTYSEDNLYDKLNNYEDSLAKKYYSGDEEILRKFVFSLFTTAKSPYKMEASLAQHFSSRFSDNFLLEKQDLYQINLNYFKDYCASRDSFDDNVWYLYNKNKRTKWIPTGPNSHTSEKHIPDEANKVLKKFIFEKDLDGFLLSIIRDDHHTNKMYYVDHFVLQVFKSWSSFEEELNALDEGDHNYLEEFKKFYAVFAENGHSKYVKFDFSIIPIKENTH